MPYGTCPKEASGYLDVHSFTTCSLWESNGDCYIQWVTHLPSRFMRPDANVIFDSSTCLIIAASALEARFTSFDEIEDQTCTLIVSVCLTY